MANYTNSPNMSLPIPTSGVETGPNWALDLNNCLSIIDSHDHSSGKGTQVTPSGISINSDLTFGSNNATALRSVRFTAQSGTLSGSLDLACIYANGVDLYYRDGNGNNVRITQSGGVAGSNGSIGGLTSPASATYVSATPAFVFQSAVNTAANLDGGSLTIRKLTASSPGITLTAPSALSAGYSLTLPLALPSSKSFLLVDNSGNSTTWAPSVQVSSSTGNLLIITSTTYVAVTNLSVTLTTNGYPVYITLIPDGTAASSIRDTTGQGVINVSRGATILAEYNVAGTNAYMPPGIIHFVDTPSAGTYTYTINAKANTSGLQFNYVKLLAYEVA